MGFWAPVKTFIGETGLVISSPRVSLVTSAKFDKCLGVHYIGFRWTPYKRDRIKIERIRDAYDYKTW